ncbi:MAG: FKBP-type peptidyl-prolyl cis-trans isomerase [Paludibacter sp.]
MKKTILILAAVSMVFASADAQLFKAKAKKGAVVTEPVKVFTSDVDSMSYALGINVGTDFSKNLKGIPGGKSNIDLIIKGFTTAMKGDSALMKPEVATEYFKNYIGKAQAKDTELKKAAGEKFLAENKTKEGVKTTASGLQYQVLVAKDGPKPAATDTVKVHYTGTLVDGTKFDSSIDRGEPVSFPLNQVIPGWTEGVQLMSVGSKFKFVIPYNLGYGEKGSGPIPAFSTLIFEVELLDIKPFKQPAPKVEVKEVEQPKVAKPAKKGKK